MTRLAPPAPLQASKPERRRRQWGRTCLQMFGSSGTRFDLVFMASALALKKNAWAPFSAARATGAPAGYILKTDRVVTHPVHWGLS